MATACDKLIKDCAKGRKDSMKLRIQCSTKIIVLGAAVVTSGAAVSVAVAGGLSPIGI